MNNNTYPHHEESVMGKNHPPISSSTTDKDPVVALIEMKDDELYIALQMVMQNRKPEFSQATDEYGWPERAAKLAVIRYILCG